MKKIMLPFIIILILSLGGCSLLVMNFASNADVETLKSWSFQSNTGTDDYSLFFGLLNSNNKYISADVDVDIRIVNDAGEEVYNATKSVSEKDFDNYESQAAGKQYLANIRIPSSEIKSGKSSNGTVYLTVYKDDIVDFNEVNCAALYCLPVADVQLSAKDLPVEISIKGYTGSVESILKVTDVSYLYEKEYTPKLKITFSGEKIYGSNSGYDIISYKLYDSKDYLVDSGNVYLRALSEGDKFKDDSIVIYDITPGENYTVQFFEYSW